MLNKKKKLHTRFEIIIQLENYNNLIFLFGSAIIQHNVQASLNIREWLDGSFNAKQPRVIHDSEN